MKNLKLFSFLAGIAILGFVSCQKGDTGPAGPAGPTNVLHSAWLTLNTPFNTTDSLYEETITASGLTSAILDSGVVLSYLAIPNVGDTAVYSVSEASTFYGGITQELHVGQIDLYALYDWTGNLYRYVLIPGTILTNGVNGTKYTKQELQSMSYQQIQNTLKGLTN